MSNGKKHWYIVDGYLPYPCEIKKSEFKGHEAIMILNCNTADAEVLMDIYFEDKEPIKNIKFTVKAERVKCIRMDHPEEIGDIVLGIQEQYSLRFQSSINVVIQYGRMDIAQANLAYIGTMGYSE